ncbi:MAG: thiamine phosphate synthase [Pseudomonadota bacterium]
MGLKHQAVVARKWRTAMRQIESHFPPALPPLLLLTDPERIPNPVSLVDKLPAGSGLIYRHFGAEDRFEIAARLSQKCKEHKIAFLISADPDLARATNAAGIHWPEKWISRARRWQRCFRIQTASAHTPHAIRTARNAGMDAALVSTVFVSASSSAGRPIGSIRLRKLQQTAGIPLYGLGGINAQNAQQVSAYSGIASVSGLAIAKIG